MTFYLNMGFWKVLNFPKVATPIMSKGHFSVTLARIILCYYWTNSNEVTFLRDDYLVCP